MANPHRGEYAFTVDDRPYVLRFYSGAVCDMEQALGQTLNQISEQMRDPATMRMTTVRVMFCAGLSHAHPDMDDKARLALFNALPPAEAFGHVAKAFGLAFGVEGAADTENPPQPGVPSNGTGLSSTVSGSG